LLRKAVADNDNPEDKPQDITIEAKPIPMTATVGTGTIWLTYPFAKEWFEDALHEAKTGSDHNARRREIVFAVCFAESYLFEWIRDQVLDRNDFQRLVTDLNHYFPPGEWQPVTEKWKLIPKRLLRDGRVPATPDLSQSYWERFTKLVDMRNGLVHARSSRPEATHLQEIEKPHPSKGYLDKLPAGWATGVVVTLVKELHKAVGTSEPDWLVTP
jgi:hypothetical protein